MSRQHASRYAGLGLLALSLVLPRVANSHGDAAWIMQNPSTSYCCGPSDCQRVPKSAVHTVTQGYHVTVGDSSVVIPFEKTLVSIDDDFWACIPPGSPMKCFFAPPLGA